MNREQPTAGCDAWQAAVAAYVDGECRGAEADAVRAHLLSCAACRAEASTLTALSQAMRTLADERAPPAFAVRLMARLDGEDDLGVHGPSGASGPAVQPARWRAAVAVAAALCLAVIVGVVVRSALPAPRDVVDAAVHDFITYRDRGWTLDLSAHDGATVAAWAESRVPFALPTPADRLGVFELRGVRLCWLLDRRLVGVSYRHGEERAVLYVMTADGLDVPPPDRRLPDGRDVAVVEHMGLGVAVWRGHGLVYLLIAPGRDLGRALARLDAPPGAVVARPAV
jgi:anti-sigma factor RsiW